jgi:signal transduction histidine kinase
MTGAPWLDWAVMALSLFNMILLLWLGLTVLLNAERRSWGIWLGGGGLLLGGAFFVSHSAILGRGLREAGPGMDFWWRVGWLPVVTLPFVWYVVMLWYAGFWERDAHLRDRHRPWLVAAALLLATLVGMLAWANPLPLYSQAILLQLAPTPSILGVPLLIAAYPPYIVLCIALSLDALRRPGLSGRVMGDLARHRARPWLAAASGALLAASLLVAWAMLWIVHSAGQLATYTIIERMAFTVARFDLAISTLIAIASLLLGQAIVSYEVFAGRTLPQRGLARNWRSAAILAAGYAMVVGWSMAFALRPTYSLLLTAILMVTFYALASWRSFAERKRYIEHLRPFVASQRLYEDLLAPSDPTQPDAAATHLFHALCEEVLGARSACLAALGPLVPLAGPPLVYPDGEPSDVPLAALSELAAQLQATHAVCIPVDPGRWKGASWGVPLRSARDLIGVLLLGEKRDGGLYAEEEIEIARATGERLMDIRAAGEVSRRLVTLLRQRLAEVQVVEGQGRRVLHDRVLPQLHAALLYLTGQPDSEPIRLAVEALAAAHREIAALMRDVLPPVPRLLQEQGLVAALRASVEHDPSFARVSWQVDGEAEQRARTLPLFVSEVLLFAAQELVRNAARHGRGDDPTRPLSLQIALDATEGLRLAVADDGAGFERGTAPAGSQSGLQFHSAMLAAVGASLQVASLPSDGTQAIISLPPEALAALSHHPQGT